MGPQEKKAVFLRFLKVAGIKGITTVSKENFEKKWRRDNGEFQQQSTQRLLDRYDHMNGQNDRWTMWLKPIQVEYYSIENQKSFSNTM